MRRPSAAVVEIGAKLIGVVEACTPLRYPGHAVRGARFEALTRGSRLEAEAYAALSARGFKSVVDLTLEGTRDAELAPAAGLSTLNVPILDNDVPTMDQMQTFLDFVTAAANSPAYVHCEAGKGRTGVAVAVYRMAVDHWSAAEALAEAREYGLSLPEQVEFIDKLRSGAPARPGSGATPLRSRATDLRPCLAPVPSNCLPASLGTSTYC